MNERPNILLIVTEHWRGDCIGKLGHPVLDTPHLDTMATLGVTFTQAYTSSASCIAARRSLMTGMTPAKHGMMGFKHKLPWKYEHTLGGEMTRAGYQTISVGKTHHWPTRLHLGFEELVLPEDYSEWINRQTGVKQCGKLHGVQGNSWVARPHHLPEHQTQEAWLTNQAMDRIEKRDTTRPFLMHLSYNAVHPPICPPQVYYDQYIHREMPAPAKADWSEKHARDARNPMDANAWRGRIPDHLNQRVRAAYFAYQAFVDAQISRLMDWLGRTYPDEMRNTMVLFTADHGEMLGDHNLWRKTYGYDASARIPMIVQPPMAWKLARNFEESRVVGIEDIMPTLLDVAGAPVPDTVEGKSLLPLIKQEKTDWREYYHHEHSPCYHKENANHMLTNGQWKYIWNPINGEEQLFHIAEDPHEQQERSSVPAHNAELATWRKRMVDELKNRPEGWSNGEDLTPAPYEVWREPVGV